VREELRTQAREMPHEKEHNGRTGWRPPRAEGACLSAGGSGGSRSAPVGAPDEAREKTSGAAHAQTAGHHDADAGRIGRRYSGLGSSRGKPTPNAYFNHPNAVCTRRVPSSQDCRRRGVGRAQRSRVALSVVCEGLRPRVGAGRYPSRVPHLCGAQRRGGAYRAGAQRTRGVVQCRRDHPVM